MKTCSLCKKEKEITNFSKKTKGRLQPYCQECNRLQKKEWYQNNQVRERQKIKERQNSIREEQRDYIWKYLLLHPCVDCGETNPLVLEFDHVRGIKNANVGSLLLRGVAMNTLLEEINKCDIRCANCHKIKTINQLGWWKSFR